MANLVKSYFLPPAWVYKPDGPIFLGSLISDPHQPQVSLNPGDIEAGSKIPLALDDQQSPYRAILSSSAQRTFGISASFLSLFGAGNSIGMNREKYMIYTLNADHLNTREINPDLGYLNAALSQPLAQAFMEKKRFRSDVYCITGLMVGDNVSIASIDGKSKDVHGSFDVGAAISATPLEIVPTWSASAVQNTLVASQRKSTIILGYRLKRITYLKKEKRVAKIGDFHKGTLLADRDETREHNHEPEYFVEALELNDDEVGADDFEFPSVTATDSTTTSKIIELVVPVEG